MKAAHEGCMKALVIISYLHMKAASAAASAAASSSAAPAEAIKDNSSHLVGHNEVIYAELQAAIKTIEGDAVLKSVKDKDPLTIAEGCVD